MSFDVKEEFKELEKVEHEEAQQHAAIQRVIAAARNETKEYRFGEFSIRVRAIIPRDQRRIVTQLRRLAMHESAEEDEEVLLDRSEDLFYTFLARMCLDTPFDVKETWEVIDVETGVAPKVAIQIIEMCSEDEKRVAEFRPE